MSNDLDALISDITELAENEIRHGAWLEEATEFVWSAAKLLAPKNTGNLAGSINFEIVEDGDTTAGVVFTDTQYATYVEYGTGRKGAEHHEGINPDVTPNYTLEPWWIPEELLDPSAIGKYNWIVSENKDGQRFYRSEGQPAQPYMYPALKDNEDAVMKICERYLSEVLK